MRFYTNVTCIGNKIALREIDTERDDSTINDKVQFGPRLFTPTHNPDTPYRSIYNQPLQCHNFTGLHDYWEFRKKYGDVDNRPMFGDINPAIQFIVDEYPDDIEFDFNLIRTFYIDIEVYTHDGRFPDPHQAKYPVSAISIYDSKTKLWYQWGLEYEGCFKGADGYDPTLRHHNKTVVYAGFDKEVDLLKHFLKWWKKFCPDIVTGWNSTGFDLTYLINRIRNDYPDDLKATDLSPWGKITDREVWDDFGNKRIVVYDIVGISDLDYLVQYKKHSFTPQESYKLDHIAYAENLSERKMEYDEVSGLHELYMTDYQKYIDYNVRDTEIVKMLEEKRGILFLIVAAAYRSRCNFEDIISPLRTWDALIYNYLNKHNRFFPPKSRNSKKEQFAGAFVKAPQIGWHDWVVSVDLASLYPSLIRQINVSPETLVRAQDIPNMDVQKATAVSVRDLINKVHDTSPIRSNGVDLSLAANGALFRRDEQGFLPVLLEALYFERKAEKKKMLEYSNELERIDVEINKRIRK